MERANTDIAKHRTLKKPTLGPSHHVGSGASGLPQQPNHFQRRSPVRREWANQNKDTYRGERNKNKTLKRNKNESKTKTKTKQTKTKNKNWWSPCDNELRSCVTRRRRDASAMRAWLAQRLLWYALINHFARMLSFTSVLFSHACLTTSHIVY